MSVITYKPNVSYPRRQERTGRSVRVFNKLFSGRKPGVVSMESLLQDVHVDVTGD
jgi:hypothetical protein